MPDLIAVTDAADPRLADYAALTDAALRKRYEHAAGVLVAEGPNPVRALIASRYPLRSVLLAEERLASMADVLAEVTAPVYVCGRELLYEVVRFKLHQGVIACGGRIPPPAPAEVVGGADRLALLEGLNDHENLGSLFRCARGLGVTGVLLGPGCADPLYRRSVRVSMGHVLHVEHTWVPDLAAGFSVLAAHGVTTVALTPDPTAPDIRTLGLPPDTRIAVLLGAEGPGLSSDALRGADLRARITMHGGVDSLNVATAAAIAFHALARGPADADGTDQGS
jgi:tRNA G18 (ribose-2'-O)-methylase SpoU